MVIQDIGKHYLGNDLPTISIIVSTLDRPEDLKNLFKTIINQGIPPLEVIIIDDSPSKSAENIVNLFSSDFLSIKCKIAYVQGEREGLPCARNLGVSLCKGDLILFLDDDTLLETNLISALATFVKANPSARGIQPKLYEPPFKNYPALSENFKNVCLKALGQTYRDKNKQLVRRSGMSVFPKDVTKLIRSQRLSGCCMCYIRDIFSEVSFDTNLKRGGYLEDLDFSYRVYKKWPGSLWVIPETTVTHIHSGEARLHVKLSAYMDSMYWFYVFFKDFFDGSIQNLLAFAWAVNGKVGLVFLDLVIERASKKNWVALIYLVAGYAVAIKNLKSILKGNLEFFNKTL